MHHHPKRWPHWHLPCPWSSVHALAAENLSMQGKHKALLHDMPAYTSLLSPVRSLLSQGKATTLQGSWPGTEAHHISHVHTCRASALRRNDDGWARLRHERRDLTGARETQLNGWSCELGVARGRLQAVRHGHHIALFVELQLNLVFIETIEVESLSRTGLEGINR